MVKKTLGYVELEWTCPQCGTRNSGPQKSCSSCGAAQPKSSEFHQAAQDELITDPDEIARAQAGPDVHCAFCGARNPAGAQRCTQCNADLSSATARESGRVVGAFRTKPAAKIACPQCGTHNDPNNLKCTQCGASLPRSTPKPAARQPRAAPGPPRAGAKVPTGIAAIAGLLGVALIALVICGVLVLVSQCMRTEEVEAQVQSVEWMRSITIEELRPVEKQNWRDEIPAGASLGQCTKKRHHTQDSPAPNATEVCGTAYVQDTGTGHGKVVQDCRYEVYEDWCTYRVEEWQQVDEQTLHGSDLNPRWPSPALGTRQRQGKQQESYTVVFLADDKTYTYRTSDVERFTPCQPGSRWVLKVNGLGGVTSIQPAL